MDCHWRITNHILLANLVEIKQGDFGQAFIINNLAICIVELNATNPSGQFQIGIRLPISYKDVNYKAIVNTDSAKANFITANATSPNDITIQNLGGATEYTVRAITVGLLY